MYDKLDFANRIHELRKTRWEKYQSSLKDKNSPNLKYAYCKTQGSLAIKLGVERRAVNSWENGTSSPSLENLVNLCDLLDCNIDYLLGANDYAEESPIALASHFSGISPEIIKYGRENPDYLECLNYFMLPENCSSLFNKITLATWKKFQIDSSLENIKSPLKEDIFRFFDEFNAITPFNELNKNKYKDFLESKLPKEKLILSSKKSKKGIYIKACFIPSIYQNFFPDKEFDYTAFINYLVDYTFEPLSHNAMIELQKAKLSHAFTNLFTKYLEEL